MIIILYSDNGNNIKNTYIIILFMKTKYISLEAITQSDIYWMLRVKNVLSMNKFTFIRQLVDLWCNF